jgi:hypothetical protein
MGRVQILLTPRKSATGEDRAPTLNLAVFVPKQGETLEALAARFMKRGRWDTSGSQLGLDERASTMEDGTLYRGDGGGKVLLIVFERSEPPLSGYLFEEPQDTAKTMEEERLYRFSNCRERIRGRLFCQIWLEAPAAFYDDAYREFTQIMKGAVIE